MNLKTTIALLILVGAGVALAIYGLNLPARLNPVPTATPSQDHGSRDVLAQWTPGDLQRIEVRAGDQVTVLERTNDGWKLPGEFPIRAAEVNALVDLVGNLRSRFQAEPLQGLLTLKTEGKQGTQSGSRTFKVSDDTTAIVFTGAEKKESNVKDAFKDLKKETHITLTLGEGDRVTGVEIGRAATLEGPKLVTGTFVSFEESTLANHGLDHPKVVLKVKVDGQEHEVDLGERSSKTADRFERPTFGRVDGKAELLQLAPGLIGQLNRPTDYYQQRRLFESERVARETDPAELPGEKIEQLAAKQGLTLTIANDKDAKEKFTLAYDGNDWKLTQPYLDRPDKRALEKLRAALSDVWAEKFVAGDPAAIAGACASPTGSLTGSLNALAWLDVTTPAVLPRWLLQRAGLDKPERTLTVAAGGKTRALQIGDISSRRSRTVMRQPPPNPMGFPMPPIPETVTEELRYARLQGNPQVFEIKTDKLNDIFVPLENLRDPRVAAFKSDDVKRIEIAHKGQDIVLTRDAGDKERWRLLKPIQADANRENVNELLTRLSGMDARGKDVTYNPDPKTTGLDKPTSVIKLTIEEEIKKDDKKEKKTRTLTLQLGKEEGDKLYVRDVDYPRVNAIDKSLAATANRDVLAWRGKRLFDFLTTDLTQVVLHKGDEKITLKQTDGKWTLTAPAVTADADPTRTSKLANNLSKLEVLEYVNDNPTPQDLEAQYGLAKPAVTATLTLTDTTKPARTLLVGRPRGPKNGVFAKLADGKSVFAISNDIADSLGGDSLAWRSKRLLEFTPVLLDTLTIQRGEQTIALRQDKGQWQLTAPAKTGVDGERVGQMTAALSNLDAVEYLANTAAADQLESLYGLGKPALTVKLTFVGNTRPDQALLIGKARNGKAELFGKLAGNPGVFAINNSLQAALDVDALALLPKQLWQVPGIDITGVKVQKTGQGPFQLTRKPAGWQITGPFDAGVPTARVVDLLGALAAPQCDSYKAFEAKDLVPFGLDKPALHITIRAKDGTEHGLLLGALTAAGSSSRYAKQTTSPAIFVVNGALAGTIDRGALDLLDPLLVKIEPGQLERVQTKTGADLMTLEKKGKEWQVLDTPASPFKADAETVAQVAQAWHQIVAERYAAYGPKVDLDIYGLDKPSSTITVKVRVPGEAAVFTEHVVQLGMRYEKNGDYYARVDRGPGVVILGPATVKELTHGYLDYVNRNVLKFDPSTVKQLKQERGGEKLEVNKGDEGWMLTSPAKERADDKAMAALLAQLSDLRAVRVTAFPAKDLKTYGLDEPYATITLGLNEDQKPARFTIKIGKLAEEPSGDTYAQVAGNAAVVVLPGPVVKPLLAGVLAFRDRTLAKFASADVVRLERDRRKATFAQVDGSWKLTEPIKADAEQDELDDFVNSLARLRADELIVEKPTAEELKKYGLEKPEARWRLQNGAKQVLDLQIGGTEENGPRRYGRLGGRDLVFLLDSRLSSKVVGEYRTRTVWSPPLDAASVDAIRFGYEKNPFTLERVAGAWQEAGKPDAKINTEVVNETLAALAGLKLQRYVMDKDADLQLYGLKKPELTLEATTRTGKRTLQIGAREGESQRRYARVDLRGQTEVFLISEPDAAKLMRDLAAFTKANGTK